MEIGVIKAQLKRIFVPYPSLGDWLNDHKDPVETLDAWCGMFRNCTEEIFREVIDDIVSGVIDPLESYDKPDALPRRIRDHYKKRRTKQVDKQLSNAIREQARSDGAWKTVERSQAGSVAIKLGSMVKAGLITREENDLRMVDLFAYLHGRQKAPKWWQEVAAWTGPSTL